MRNSAFAVRRVAGAAGVGAAGPGAHRAAAYLAAYLVAALLAQAALPSPSSGETSVAPPAEAPMDQAQPRGPSVSPLPEECPVPAPVPFGVGEKLSYEVSVGLFGSSGHGTMEVVEIDTVRQRPAYRLRLTVKGGVLFAKVDDRMESWLDIFRLFSLRFEQDQHEVRYKRHRILDFFPEERRWTRVGSDEEGTMPTDAPLDDVSFLYFVRTIPLEVGQTYTFDRYFRNEGNPVILKVLRKERVKLPAGKFDTIVVRPIIRAGGLFGQGGEAEVFFTDDERRLPVQVRSKLPVIGHLTLKLEEYRPGTALTGISAGTEAGM